MFKVPETISKELKVRGLPIPFDNCIICDGLYWQFKNKIKCPNCGSLRAKKGILYIRSERTQYWTRRCREASKIILSFSQVNNCKDFLNSL